MKILEKMNSCSIMRCDHKYNRLVGRRTASLFGSGNTVFVDYNRLGDLQACGTSSSRSATFYPKLDTAQKNYVTSTHDTTEVGAIPNTVTDLEFVTCLGKQAMTANPVGSITKTR